MEFVQIFTQMHWLPAILLIVGFVLFFIEVFVPGFSFFGIVGGLLLTAGTVVRICGGLNLAQSLSLILVIFGVICLGVIFMIFSAKYGLLGRSGLFENKTTLPKNYNKPERNLRKLVGKSGKTISKLDLGGQAKIKGKIYDVVSVSSYIEPNKNIKVVEIKDDTIMVRKWFE